MVRLVFRPYTQLWRSICTSEPLRASIRVSSDFTLVRHSSPSFGSQHLRSYSNLSKKQARRSTPTYNSDRSMMRPSLMGKDLTDYFHYAHGFFHPKTRAHVRLLGPCFKTGRLKPFRQHLRSGWCPKPTLDSQIQTPSTKRIPESIPFSPKRCTQKITRWRTQRHVRIHTNTSQIFSSIQRVALTVVLAKGALPQSSPTHQTDVDLSKITMSASIVSN